MKSSWPCPECNGLRFVADLNMVKVQEFMLYYGAVSSESTYYDGYKVRVVWRYRGMRGFDDEAVADDILDNHYLCVLEVCQTGALALLNGGWL